MTEGQWEDAWIGDNVSLIRPWNVAAARAALKFLEEFKIVPDNAPTNLGISPTLDKVFAHQLTEEQLAKFDEATEHPFECDCDLCQAWWAAVPPEE